MTVGAETPALLKPGAEVLRAEAHGVDAPWLRHSVFVLFFFFKNSKSIS